MISEWTKFKGWEILEFFLLHPNTKIHINALSRELKIGPQTAHRFCLSYNEDNLIKQMRVGNVHQFYLNEDDPRVKALKKFMGPYLVADEQYLKPYLEKNKSALSVSIYGSFASGEYGDKSDLDILIITADETKQITADLSKLELRLGREANVITVTFAKWRQMEREKNKFFINIKNKHVLIWGNPL